MIAEPLSKQATTASLEGRRVHIISKREVWSKVACETLRSAGAILHLSSDLDEAFEVVELESFHLTLLDADSIHINEETDADRLYDLRGRLVVIYTPVSTESLISERHSLKIVGDAWCVKPLCPAKMIQLVESELENAEACQEARQRRVTTASGNPNILLVEDRIDWLQVLLELLSNAGFENVIVARSLEQASEHLHEREFGLVIADCRLVDYDPENTDGLKVIRILRELDPDYTTGCIVLTAYADAVQQRVAITELGCSSFIPKNTRRGDSVGFDAAAFLAAVAQIVEPRGRKAPSRDRYTELPPIALVPRYLGRYQLEAGFPDFDDLVGFRVGSSHRLLARLGFVRHEGVQENIDESIRRIIFELEIVRPREIHVEPALYKKIELPYGESEDIEFGIMPLQTGIYTIEVVLYCANRWMGKLSFNLRAHVSLLDRRHSTSP